MLLGSGIVIFYVICSLATNPRYDSNDEKTSRFEFYILVGVAVIVVGIATSIPEIWRRTRLSLDGDSEDRQHSSPND